MLFNGCVGDKLISNGDELENRLFIAPAAADDARVKRHKHATAAGWCGAAAADSRQAAGSRSKAAGVACRQANTGMYTSHLLLSASSWLH